uniref:PUM-HD domain-containing protein n=1 Tax=Globodera rostochiensis TaxID=31243 RepID=A0A914I318_GLORO
MIEHGLPEDRERIVRSLQGDIMKYAQDKFSKLSRDRNGIINEILAQVIPLSLHKYGSWVIECVLEHCMEQQKRLASHTNYGHDPTAHMIEHGLPEDRERIVRSLQGDIMKYAQDKFSKLSRNRNGVGIGGQSVTN